MCEMHDVFPKSETEEATGMVLCYFLILQPCISDILRDQEKHHKIVDCCGHKGPLYPRLPRTSCVCPILTPAKHNCRKIVYIIYSVIRTVNYYRLAHLILKRPPEEQFILLVTPNNSVSSDIRICIFEYANFHIIPSLLF